MRVHRTGNGANGPHYPSANLSLRDYLLMVPDDEKRARGNKKGNGKGSKEQINQKQQLEKEEKAVNESVSNKSVQADKKSDDKLSGEDLIC